MLQKGFSKILTLLIIAVIVAAGVLVYRYQRSPSQKIFSCEKEDDCVLAYTGMESCGPCDSSDESMQCVSPEEAERLEQERIKKHGHVLCEMCPPPTQILFRCICKGSICVKTANCEEDEDCYSRAFRDLYKCKNGKCSYVSEEDETAEWKTYVSSVVGWEMRFPSEYVCYRSCPIEQVEGDRITVQSLDLRMHLYSEGPDQVEPPIAVSVKVDSPRHKPSEQDLLDHINSQLQIPENWQEGIEILKIHDEAMVNNHKMVKIETIRGGTMVDLYFLEKDETTYIRIQVAKAMPEEAEKRAGEIKAIISTFKFID